MNRQQSKDTQKMLEAIREDIRRMGPDGTSCSRPSMGCEVDYSLCGVCGKPAPCDHVNKLTREQAEIVRSFTGVFLTGMTPCPQEFMDVINKNMDELLA